MSASDSEDAMQRFLRSLEIPATGEPAPGGTQFSVTASAVSESMSLPDDASLPDFSFTSGLPLVPGTVTVAPLIVMDPQALQALGNFVRSLRKDTWLPEQMKEWDGFIAAGSLEERIAIHTVNTLDVKDMLSHAKKHGAWSLTPGMKVIFKSYALAHLLSSSLVAYCGTNNFTAVIDHMRANGVDELPDPEDAVAKKILNTSVKEALTSARSHIKEKLKKSRGEKWDLGTLVKSIAGSSQVPATLKLYCCVAFLRWHLDNNSFDEDQWWVDGPDATLKKWRLGGEVITNSAFKKMFDTDLEKYGPLSKKPVEPQATTWMKNLDAHAALVTPKLSTLEKTAKGKTGQCSRKRRREVEADDKSEAEE